MGDQLSIEMIEMLELVLPIYCLANLAFEMMVGDSEVSTCAYVGIVIGVLNAILPMQDINEKLFYVKPADPTLKTFEE